MNTRPCRNVYVHVPFCNGKCAYCAFYSEPEVNPASVTQWLDRLENDAARKSAQTLTLDTLYIGGGTPTALPPETLKRLFRILERHFSFLPGAEISIECNPESLTEEKAEILARHVNRVSMGVQSFRPDFREKIGRRPSDAHAVETALRLLRANGIDNIGFDLIYALPGETLANWREELDTALSHGVRHISAYSLSIEDGTELAARGLPPEDNELSFAMWEAAQKILSAHGMPRYEISNYARPGKECRHNNFYWTGVPYLGFGIGAASFYRQTRYTNRRERREYEAILSEKNNDAQTVLHRLREEIHVQTREEQMEEFLFLGLRRMEGIAQEEFERTFSCSLRDVYGSVISDYVQRGFLRLEHGRLALTDAGIDVSNVILSGFLLS